MPSGPLQTDAGVGSTARSLCGCTEAGKAMSWGCLTSAQLMACGTMHLLLKHWGYIPVALRDAEARKGNV